MRRKALRFDRKLEISLGSFYALQALNMFR